MEVMLICDCGISWLYLSWLFAMMRLFRAGKKRAGCVTYFECSVRLVAWLSLEYRSRLHINNISDLLQSTYYMISLQKECYTRCSHLVVAFLIRSTEGPMLKLELPPYFKH